MVVEDEVNAKPTTVLSADHGRQKHHDDLLSRRTDFGFLFLDEPGNYQLRARESQVAIGRPASGNSLLVDHDQPVSVGQRQRLVGELLNQSARLRQFLAIERLNHQNREIINEVEKLDGPIRVVPSQKPAVPSATTSAEVTRRGGLENSLRNRGW
jgi:hypothetical protein